MKRMSTRAVAHFDTADFSDCTKFGYRFTLYSDGHIAAEYRTRWQGSRNRQRWCTEPDYVEKSVLEDPSAAKGYLEKFWADIQDEFYFSHSLPKNSTLAQKFHSLSVEPKEVFWTGHYSPEAKGLAERDAEKAASKLARDVKRGHGRDAYLPTIIREVASTVRRGEMVSHREVIHAKSAPERKNRIDAELARARPSDLDRPMCEVNEDCISRLASEAGYSSARSYLNDLNLWGQTLRWVINDLVNMVYTIDGQTYETIAEREAAERL